MNHSTTFVSTLFISSKTSVFDDEKCLFGCGFYPSFSRLKFTGKELDEETGYGYFGARYYDATLLTGWTAVDPMSDKYPSLSPYNYCAWNPMKLVDPDGKEIGWYIDNNGTVIGKDGVDDDRIYMVNDRGDINKIKKDNFDQGVSRSELKGDVVEVPSYEARQQLQEIWQQGRDNQVNTGEYGMLIYTNNENELGVRLYHAQNPIEKNQNGDIRGSLSWKNSELIGVSGASDASNLIIEAHTHNVNDGKPHPPTVCADNVPQGVIGVVFDYHGGSSNVYIYDNNTRTRSRSFMSSSTFFQPFVSPDGKKL